MGVLLVYLLDHEAAGVELCPNCGFGRSEGVVDRSRRDVEFILSFLCGLDGEVFSVVQRPDPSILCIVYLVVVSLFDFEHLYGEGCDLEEGVILTHVIFDFVEVDGHDGDASCGHPAADLRLVVPAWLADFLLPPLERFQLLQFCHALLRFNQ